MANKKIEVLEINMKQEKKAPSVRIPDMFGSMMQGDSERLQIAKELFTGENIDMKTELDDREINLIARAKFIEEVFALDSLGIFIDKFFRTRVSKARQGRKEFVETVKNQEKDNGLAQLGNIFKQGKF